MSGQGKNVVGALLSFSTWMFYGIYVHSDPVCPKSFPLCEMPDPNPGRLPQQTEPPTLQMSDHSFTRDCLRND